jgi:hypothetical protein
VVELITSDKELVCKVSKTHSEYRFIVMCAPRIGADIQIGVLLLCTPHGSKMIFVVTYVAWIRSDI